MRHLLNTLFVLTEDSYLSLDGENVVVSREKQEVGRFPLHTLRRHPLLLLSRRLPCPDGGLLGARRRSGLLLSAAGSFWPVSWAKRRGMSCFASSSTARRTIPLPAAGYAKGFLLGKVYNARWVLERATRDHPQRVPVEKLKSLSQNLAAALPNIENAVSLEELRGLEGAAAAAVL